MMHPEPSAECAMGWWVRTSPAPQLKAALHPFYSYMFFSTFASLKERKLRDLEVEFETRAKDVKASVAELDIQVRV